MSLKEYDNKNISQDIKDNNIENNNNPNDDKEELCERLLNQYGDTMLRVCYQYLKDYHLAEDAVQETFIKAVNNYNSFKGNSTEKTWLTRIALNCCKNIMRTHWFKYVYSSMTESNFTLSSNTHNNSCSQEHENVLEAVMSLKRADREVIILYYYMEFSLKEIAQITGQAENTINQRLHRARKRLKKVIMEDML